MRKGQYEQAEKYLEYFSIQNPERKRKQAQIYGETGRIREAYKAYEELLFSDYQRVNLELYGMYRLALQEQDVDTVKAVMKEMLASVEKIGEFRNSPLYEHMEFQEMRKPLDF